MKRIALGMFLVMTGITTINAQTDVKVEPTVLKGTVTDLKEFKPLDHVEVSLMSFDDKFKKTTETDAEGKFVLSDVPAGTYKICYEKRGFENGVCQSITVQEGQTKTIGLTMFGR